MLKTKYILALVTSALLVVTSHAGVENGKTQATNLSSRGNVGTGDNVLIGGFIVGGRDFVTVVIRALGPTLNNFGLAGKTLNDPVLSVYDENGSLIVKQDSFLELSSQDLARLASNNLTPQYAREAAVIVSRPAGVRTTAIVSGKNNATGIALVEAYKIQ